MKTRNIRLTVAYDGTQYHGWQRQKNALTIQEIIENALETITDSKTTLFASGRTDAGVHAQNQVCNFRTESPIPEDPLLKGLNSLLPSDILIKNVCVVSAGFHSRYAAKSKIYEYRILNRASPDIFRRHYLWHVRAPLNFSVMADCTHILRGTHDFSSFRSSGSENRNPVRTILKCRVDNNDAGLFRLTFEADGFLRHMVRNIVGTLVEVGFGRISVKRFAEILESRDRREAGKKAPAQGLFLMQVKY